MIYRTGAIFSPIDERDYAITKYSPEQLDKNQPVPEVIAEFRQQHIDNQESTSMCAAYSACNQATVRILQRTGDYILLSPAAFYGNREYMSYSGEGMMGRDVQQGGRKSGFMRRDAFPVEKGTYQQCAELFADKSLSYKEQSIAYRTEGFVRLNDAWEVAQYIIQERIGCLIAFNIYENIREAYSTGIIPQPSGASLGGHMVRVEGIINYKGGTYCLVPNTWGSDWGDRGYCYLPINMIREGWGEYDRPPLSIDNEPHEIIFFTKDIDNEMNTKTIWTDCNNLQLSDHPDAYAIGNKIIVRNGSASAYVENRLMSIVRPLWESIGWQVDWYGDYVIMTRGKTESQFKKDLGLI